MFLSARSSLSPQRSAVVANIILEVWKFQIFGIVQPLWPEINEP